MEVQNTLRNEESPEIFDPTSFFRPVANLPQEKRHKKVNIEESLPDDSHYQDMPEFNSDDGANDNDAIEEVEGDDDEYEESGKKKRINKNGL